MGGDKYVSYRHDSKKRLFVATTPAARSCNFDAQQQQQQQQQQTPS